ncbi:unnamed protein product [Ectocarpus fasciculatus]
MVTFCHPAGPGKRHGSEKSALKLRYILVHTPPVTLRSQKVGQRRKEGNRYSRIGHSFPRATHVTADNIAPYVAETSAGTPKAKRGNERWLVWRGDTKQLHRGESLRRGAATFTNPTTYNTVPPKESHLSIVVPL